MDLQQKPWERQGDKGANEQNVGGGGNLTKVPINYHIDKFILKKSKKEKTG